MDQPDLNFICSRFELVKDKIDELQSSIRSTLKEGHCYQVEKEKLYQKKIIPNPFDSILKHRDPNILTSEGDNMYNQDHMYLY